MVAGAMGSSEQVSLQVILGVLWIRRSISKRCGSAIAREMRWNCCGVSWMRGPIHPPVYFFDDLDSRFDSRSQSKGRVLRREHAASAELRLWLSFDDRAVLDLDRIEEGHGLAQLRADLLDGMSGLLLADAVELLAAGL